MAFHNKTVAWGLRNREGVMLYASTDHRACFAMLTARGGLEGDEVIALSARPDAAAEAPVEPQDDPLIGFQQVVEFQLEHVFARLDAHRRFIEKLQEDGKTYVARLTELEVLAAEAGGPDHEPDGVPTGIDGLDARDGDASNGGDEMSGVLFDGRMLRAGDQFVLHRRSGVWTFTGRTSGATLLDGLGLEFRNPYGGHLWVGADALERFLR